MYFPSPKEVRIHGAITDNAGRLARDPTCCVSYAGVADAIVRGSSLYYAKIESLRALVEAVQAHPDAIVAPPRDERSKQWKCPSCDSDDALTSLRIQQCEILDSDLASMDIRISLDVDSTRFIEHVDCHEATFAGEVRINFSVFARRVNFRRTKFGGMIEFNVTKFEDDAEFGETTFADYAHMQNVHFEGPVNFSRATFFGGLRLLDATFQSEANFIGVQFVVAAEITFVKFLKRANFSGAILTNAVFLASRLRGANFELAEIEGLNVTSADLVGVRGLFGPRRAATGERGVREHEVAKARFRRRLDFMPWSALRVIGALRLFGVSYVSLIAIVLYAKLAKWFNTEFAVKVRTDAQRKIDEGIDWRWREILADLPDLPVPSHLGNQLIMILILALGATVYQIFCPQLIKEATETRWTRELKQQLIEYRSAMWSRLLWRYLAALLLSTGGGYTIVYLSIRLIDALYYLFL